MDNKELEICISAFHNGEVSEKIMLEVLGVVYDKNWEYFKTKVVGYPTPEDLKKETCQVVLGKLDRLDMTRGKVQNFCSTVMLCFMRQVTAPFRRVQASLV